MMQNWNYLRFQRYVKIYIDMYIYLLIERDWLFAGREVATCWLIIKLTYCFILKYIEYIKAIRL